MILQRGKEERDLWSRFWVVLLVLLGVLVFSTGVVVADCTTSVTAVDITLGEQLSVTATHCITCGIPGWCRHRLIITGPGGYHEEITFVTPAGAHTYTSPGDFSTPTVAGTYTVTFQYEAYSLPLGWAVDDLLIRTTAFEAMAEAVPPVIACPDNQQRDGRSYTVVGAEFDPISFSDNSPGATISNDFNASNTLAGALFPMGTTTVTWTVTDASGNMASCSFDVTVADPAIACATVTAVDITLGEQLSVTATHCINSCQVHPNWCLHRLIITGPGGYQEEIAFLVSVMPAGVHTFTSPSDFSTPTAPGTYTVTFQYEFYSMSGWTGRWAVDDLLIRTTAFEAMAETVPPVITCPDNQHRDGRSYTVVGDEFDPISFSDNSPGATISNDFNASNTLAGALFPMGTTTVTWTVTDASGNPTSCSFDVTVADPAIACATVTAVDITLGEQLSVTATHCVNSCQGHPNWCLHRLIITGPGGYQEEIAFLVSVMPAGAHTFTSPSDFSTPTVPGTYTVTFQYEFYSMSGWTGRWAVDDLLTRTTAFELTADTVVPVITCPGNQQRDGPSYTVVGGEFDPISFSDNSPGATISNDFNALNTLAGALFPMGTTTVTWTVTDASGNMASCSFDVTVADPAIACATVTAVDITLGEQLSVTATHCSTCPPHPGWCRHRLIITGPGEYHEEITFVTLAGAHTYTSPGDFSTPTVAGTYMVTFQYEAYSLPLGWAVDDLLIRTTAFEAMAEAVPPVIACPDNQQRDGRSYTVVGDEFDPISFSDNSPGATISNDFNTSNTLAGALFPMGTTTVTWTVTDASGNPTSCSFDVTVADPTIEVVKVASAGPFAVGDTIIYSYTVTNTGHVTLTGITVVDDKLGAISLGAATLAPAASTIGTVNHLVTQADVDAGSIVNIATATGTPPSGPNVSDQDDETVTFGQTPAIEVVKDASAGPFVVGDTIDYSYTVTNTGNVTLTGIMLVDDKLGSISLGTTMLAPNASTTGTATHIVTQTDIDAGSIVNIATTTGTPPSGPNVSDRDDETITFAQAPLLTIDKTGDAGPVRVGEIINYQITVTNTGNITLHNVTVTDPLLGLLQNLGTFAPGDSQSIAGTYGPVSENDLPGPIVNMAIADSDETNPVQDDHSVEILPVRIDLSLTKTVDNVSPAAGDLVTFEILVANAPGVADATNVEITDTLPAGYSFVGFAASQGAYVYTGLNSQWIVGNLPAGSSAMLHVFATVLEGGPYESPAEVTAADQDDIDSVPGNAAILSEDDDDEDVVWIDMPISDLLVTKTVDNANPLEGDTVVFTISVYNGGPFASTGIVVRDALPAGLTYVSDTSGGAYNPVASAWDVGTLIVGEAASFTLSAQVDVGTAGGTLTNTALVVQNEVEDPSHANNQDSADVTITELVAGGGGASEECDGRVIISEIAWAGTAASPEDEWIELRNIGGTPVDLTGWVLRWRKKQPVTPEDFQWKVVPLSGELPASMTPACELTDRDPEPAVEFVKREIDNLSWSVVARPVEYDPSFLILEHRSDRAILGIDAEIIYAVVVPHTLELANEGEIIELLDDNGVRVDTANAFPSNLGNWPAGDAVTFGSMERIDPLGPDERDNWHTNLGIITQGFDADGRPLVASAHVVNSLTLEEMQLFIELHAVRTLPGARLEIGLDLLREVRRETGWPWIRITRPGHDAVGGGGGIEPTYSFASRYANDTFWLGIDTAGLVPGDYLFWIIYGEGQTVLVPITVLE